MLGEIQVNLYVGYDKSIRINYIIRSMLLWRECKGSYVHSLHVSVKSRLFVRDQLMFPSLYT